MRISRLLVPILFLQAFLLAAPDSLRAQPNITAKNAVTLQVDQDGDTKADRGDTLRRTVTITNSGDVAALLMVFMALLDPNETFVPGSLKISPIAFDEQYPAVGNTQISVDAASGVLINDVDIDDIAPNPPFNEGLTLTPYDGASANGGTVHLAADGSFTYLAPAGFKGVDSFTYTITDPDGMTGSGTVSININSLVWFVDNTAAAGGNGTIVSPFDSLADLQGPGDPDGPNDIIFVYQGSGAYTGGISLEAGQKLIGQGVDLVVDGFTLVTATSDPTITNTTAANGGNGILLATNNTVSGLTVANSNGNDILGANFGTLTVSDVTLNGTGGAVSLTNGVVNATFTSLTTTSSTGSGISLQNCTGSLTSPTGSLTGASAPSVLVMGGSASLTYGGTINNPIDSSVAIQNTTGGTIALSGNITDTGGGIFLNNNPGTVIQFSGTLTVNNTGGGVAFNATAGGTVSATGPNSVLTTTNATALNVANSVIGAGGLTFRSISAGTAAIGPANGILLLNTGAGTLTVTGTGAAGSGGVIQRTTLAGVSLSSTATVSLSSMNILNGTGSGIIGTNVTGLNLTGCNITNNGNSDTDDGIQLTNLLGSSTWTNVAVSGSAHNNATLLNETGVLSSLTATGCSFNNNGAVFGNDGFLFESSGGVASSVLSATFTNCAFSGNQATGLQVFASDKGTISAFTVQGSVFTNNNIAMDFSSGGGIGDTSAFNYKILNNLTITGHNSHAGNTNHLIPNSGAMQGRIENNLLGNQAVVGSGSAIGNGFRVVGNNNGNVNILFNGNIMRQTPNGRGIDLQGRNGTGRVDATITSNNINPNDTSGFPLAAIFVQSNQAGTAGFTVRSDVRNNTVPAGVAFDLGTGFITLAETATSTSELVDVPPASANATAQLTGANTGSATASAGVALIAGPITTPP